MRLFQAPRVTRSLLEELARRRPVDAVRMYAASAPLYKLHISRIGAFHLTRTGFVKSFKSPVPERACRLAECRKPRETFVASKPWRLGETAVLDGRLGSPDIPLEPRF